MDLKNVNEDIFCLSPIPFIFLFFTLIMYVYYWFDALPNLLCLNCCNAIWKLKTIWKDFLYLSAIMFLLLSSADPHFTGFDLTAQTSSPFSDHFLHTSHSAIIMYTILTVRPPTFAGSAMDCSFCSLLLLSPSSDPSLPSPFISDFKLHYP